MNANQAGWFLLIGFVLFLWNMLFTKNFEEIEAELYSIVQDPKKLKKERKSIQIAKFLNWVSLIIYLIVIWQGFHLLQTGYSFEIDPGVAAKTAYKARGRGGLILVIIRYFPYFVIFGYGMFAINSAIDIFNIYPKRLKLLKEYFNRYEQMPDGEKIKINEALIELKRARKSKEESEKSYMEKLEKSKKLAMNQELKFLTDEDYEGWLINLESGKCKRFFLEKSSGNKKFIVEETGRIVNGKSSVEKKILLTPKEAKSDWIYYLENDYYPTTKKW